MNTPTKPVEQKARELLARLYEIDGNNAAAFTLRTVGAVGTVLDQKYALVIAALNTDEERIRRLEEALERIEAMGFVNEGHGCALIAREALSTPSKGVG